MTLLPLEDFRRVIGYHPFHFWGLADDTLVPVTSKCNDVLKEYAWQGTDRVGRNEIREAIETAENLLRDYLGYAVAPEYREETVKWQRYADLSRTRHANWDAHGLFIGTRLPWGSGQVQAVGVETLTLAGTVTTAGASLVYSDEDGDTLDDTFTATLATAETDADKFAIYFAAADRWDGSAVGEKWRLKPVRATISGGTLTITGPIWLAVLPVLYEGVGTQNLDPTATATFAASLEIYTRETEPDGNTLATCQAMLIWETEPCHGWWCCCGACGDVAYNPTDSSLDPAAEGRAIARAGIRDARLGEVNIGEALLNTTTGIWSAVSWGACREPDRVQVRYLAGQPLENQDVARKFQTITARLAAAELGRPLCACEPANKELARWQFDLARTAGNNDEHFAISAEDLNNPFGTRRGQAWAWKQVKTLRLAPGQIMF
jgi:hypothetical protein